jgi:hypothetical protein
MVSLQAMFGAEAAQAAMLIQKDSLTHEILHGTFGIN